MGFWSGGLKVSDTGGLGATWTYSATEIEVSSASDEENPGAAPPMIYLACSLNLSVGLKVCSFKRANRGRVLKSETTFTNSYTPPPQ